MAIPSQSCWAAGLGSKFDFETKAIVLPVDWVARWGVVMPMVAERLAAERCFAMAHFELVGRSVDFDSSWQSVFALVSTLVWQKVVLRAAASCFSTDLTSQLEFELGWVSDSFGCASAGN